MQVKFQQGGQMFTQYKAMPFPKIDIPQQKQQPQQKQESKNDDTKGKLTEKDLYQMIEKIDGLPNEMDRIIKQLKVSMTNRALLGMNTDDVTSLYLNALTDLKIANSNKKEFDKIIDKARENGTLGEVAITVHGNLLAQDKSTGKLVELTVTQFKNNTDKFNLLSNSNVAWMRKYSPDLAFSKDNNNMFDIISNGVSYEVITDLIQKTTIQLANNKVSNTTMEVIKGAQYVQDMPPETLRVKVSQETSDNLNSINAYVNYLTNMMPKRVKTWAALHYQGADEIEATRNLIESYLIGRRSTDIKYDISNMGKSSRSKSDSNNDEDKGMKTGFWHDVVTSKGGTSQSLTFALGNAYFSVSGKYYGSTGRENVTEDNRDNYLLSEYLSTSNGFTKIRANSKVQFGKDILDKGSYDNVMINHTDGFVVAPLPLDDFGNVNIELLEVYNRYVKKYLDEHQNVSIDDPNLIKAVMAEISKNAKDEAKFASYYNSNGTIRINKFGLFAVFNGYANEDTKVIDKNKTVPISSNNYNKMYDGSTFGGDAKQKRIYMEQHMKKWNGVSLERTVGDQDVYSAPIFIQISTNKLNAQRADDIKTNAEDAIWLDQQQQVKDKADVFNPASISAEQLYNGGK